MIATDYSTCIGYRMCIVQKYLNCYVLHC